MTSNKKHCSRRSPRPRKGQHRITIDAYIRAGRHRIDECRAKPIRQIATETGMDPVSVRRWLKRDHRDEHLRWWPNAETLMAEAKEERRPPGQSPQPIFGNLPLPDPDEIAAMQERRE